MPRISRKTVAQETVASTFCWNAGLYLRLSDKDEGDKDVSNSIENQGAMLIDYLQENTEIRQADIYIDDGKTGVNFKRPGFQRLLEDIQKKRINCVIVKDLSRLGRNVYEMGSVLETVFPLYGVRFIALTDHFDSKSANAAETGYIVPIKNLLNASYITDISQKIKSAKKLMQEKGEYIGAYAIYGYEKSKEDKHKLQIDPKAAEIIKLIFDMAEQGSSINNIARYLNEHGVDAPAQYRKKKEGKEKNDSNKNIWYHGTVRYILYSMIYTGALVQGQTAVSTPKGKKEKKPMESWAIIQNAHEPIIELARFESVQQLIEKRNKQYAPNHEAALSSANRLLGHLYCGTCKKTMKRHRVGNDNKFVYSFLCSDYSTVGICSKNRITEEKLFAVLFNVIKQQLGLLENVEELKQSYEQGQNMRKYSSALKELQMKMEQTLLLKASIYQYYKQGMLDKEAYLFLKQKYAKQGLDTEEQLFILRTKIEQEDSSKKELLTEVSPFFKLQGKMELPKELLKAIIERIEVSNGNKLRICFRYSDILKE